MNRAGHADVSILTTAVAVEQDVFELRGAGRVIARALGLDPQDQIRLATALSELGRDRLRGGTALAEFRLAAGTPPALVVTLRWTEGPEPSREALDCAARLVQEVRYEPRPPAHRIVVRQTVPATADRLADLGEKAAAMVRERGGTSREDDLRAQTRDLIVALEEAREHSEQLRLLNRELEQTNAGVLALYSELSAEMEQTNSGVVALHAELEAKSQQLREASEAKTRFWANVSHELRTPLNSVIGLARLLRSAPEELLGAEQRQQAALIAASADTLRALVNELLDVAKAESGQLVPQPAPVDLPLMFAQLEGTMTASARPGVTLVVEPPPIGLALVSDETMLARVLRNLLSNSLKFTPEGEVRLRAAAVSQDACGWVVFEVSDTGVGIAPEDHSRVFEEFYQVRGTHQRNQAGTGLGLPYARRVTELLGGTLILESAPGLGTTVIVRLPVRQGADTVDGGGVAGQVPGGRLGSLAVVDDDPAFTAAVRPALEALAERVIEFDDPLRMLEAVTRSVPDALVVDLGMPGMDGYRLVERLAAHEALSAVPVVVVTAAPRDTVDLARLAHARAVLQKGEGLNAEVLAAALGVDIPPNPRPAG